MSGNDESMFLGSLMRDRVRAMAGRIGPDIPGAPCGHAALQLPAAPAFMEVVEREPVPTLRERRR